MRILWFLLTLFSTGIAHAQLLRLPNATLTLPVAPPTYGYTSTNAFGTLTFTNPIDLVTPPGETNRIFVVGKDGTIYVITNLANPTRSVFMDISSEVQYTLNNTSANGEQGLLSLAFHPGYATNGFFYLFYTSIGGTNYTTGRHDNLSRFHVSNSNPNQGDPSSETLIISQYDRDPNHNAGDMFFGQDGYLYLSLGDEGAEYDGRTNAQRIDLNFFSGIIRIDVDKRPGNLLPNPSAESATTANYLVPADNPFVGVTSFDNLPVNPSQVRTEFWAVGLRNPWRWSFDALTGVLFCGDVGQDKFEEVDVINKGGNYGWAWLEGTNSSSGSGHGLPHLPAVNPIPPIITYAHGTATNQGNAVIGGVVYRGQRLAQLYGNYVFGDEANNFIWAIPATQTNGTSGVPAPIIIDSGAGISSFGIDPANGDVLYTCLNSGPNGVIKRIIFNNVTNGTALPPTLADTGAFTNLMSLSSPQAALQPAPGILPYNVNVPFWSDNALKSRWFSVPNTNLTIGFNPNGNWSFPTGTVWIKHFNLELTNGDPASQIRLETRLLVKNAAGVYGLTYRWGGSQTNATLVPAGGLDENFVINDGGILRTQTWHYPAQNECQTCHTPAGGFGLGFRTEQLNVNLDYGFGATNEIQALSAAGYFSSPVTNDIHHLLALAAATNTSASLEFRSRSFLMANCSQCHQPSGTAQNANWDARITTPTALAGLINGALVNNLGNAGNCVIVPQSPANSVLLTRTATRGSGSIQMPPLASGLVDSEATNLLTQWILSLTNSFWLGATPDSTSLMPGNVAQCSINFLATSDFTNDVTLSVAGLPAGMSAMFSPMVVNGFNTNAILTVTTAGNVPAGIYPLAIAGIGGGVSNGVMATLTVGMAAPGLLVWTGASHSDTNWSTAMNWTNLTSTGYGPPGISNDVVFNNAGAGQTNYADAMMTVNSLWFRLAPSAGGQIAQCTRINPGQTLAITGTNVIAGSSFVTAGYSLLVGTNNSANANGSSITATMLGAGGTFTVNRPDGVIAVAQYNTSGNHPASASTRAILDLSGLDVFSANTAQMLLGCMNNGSAGTLFLAKTNRLVIAGGNMNSTAGIDVGNNGGNAGDPSYLYLGLDNQIQVSTIRAGSQKGYSGSLAFNPSWGSQNPIAVFRGIGGGTNRVASWVVADLMAATGTANVTCPCGTNDFSGGTVDVLIDNLVLGKTGTGKESAPVAGVSSNRVSCGVLTFNAGTMDVNRLTNGWQLNADITDTGIGQINVNGSGRLVVNQQLTLASGVAGAYVGGNFSGGTLVTNLFYGPTVNATNAFAQGTLSLNGGSVFANAIVAGGGVSVVIMNGGIMAITNTMGAPGQPLTRFNLANATLHLNLNGNAVVTNITTTTLLAGGMNVIVIDDITNLNQMMVFPLISYAGPGPADGCFVKGNLPAGFSANLLNNTALKRIDLVVAPNTAVTPRFNGLNVIGTNVLFTGTNGFPGGYYYLLMSTNLAAPLDQWLPVMTNPFDLNGGFIFTNPINHGAGQSFYRIRLP